MAKEITLIALLQIETEKMSGDAQKARLLLGLVETEKMSGDAPKANLLLGLVSQSDHIPVVNLRSKAKIVSHAACHLQ